MKLEPNDQKMVVKIITSKKPWHKAVLNSIFGLAVCGEAHPKWTERFVEKFHNDRWNDDEIDAEVIDWVLSSYPAFLVCGWCFFEEYFRRQDAKPPVSPDNKSEDKVITNILDVDQVGFNKEVDEVLDKINAGIKRRDENR